MTSVFGLEFIGENIPILRAINAYKNKIEALQDLLQINKIKVDIKPFNDKYFTIYHADGTSTKINYLSAFLKPKKFLKYAIKVQNKC